MTLALTLVAVAAGIVGAAAVVAATRSSGAAARGST
jgi:hypothetical protein